jgi:hypothetical protein
MAVLPDGRVVTSGAGIGYGGDVLVWDPDEPGTRAVELYRYRSRVSVTALAALPDGRVVGGISSADQVWLWDVQGSSPGRLLACSVHALATSHSPSGARLYIGHARGGISCWEVHAVTQNMPGARQRAG